MRAYVAERRLRAATALLTAGLKVDSVASTVGFHSRSTLYRRLHHEVGLTPRQVTARPPADRHDHSPSLAKPRG